jgi:hypothetical protein
MVFKDTANTLKKILTDLSYDLEKAMKGNKSASQRVRTGTIQLAKISKLYRKESVASEKIGGTKKKPAKGKGKRGQHLKRASRLYRAKRG